MDVRRLQVARDGDGHGEFLAETQFPRERVNGRASPEHERGVQGLDSELARELDARGARGREVLVGVVARDEEVALRRQGHRRVVHARDVRRRHARVADALAEGGRRRVERGREHRVVGVRRADRVADGGDGGKACACAVCDEDLTIGDVDQLRHHTPFQHVLHLPASLDTLRGQGDTAALVGSWLLRRQRRGRLSGVSSGPATYEDLGDKVGWRERKEDGTSVNGVRNTNTIGNVGQARFSVLFDVIDDGLVVRNNENCAIWKSKSTAEPVILARRWAGNGAAWAYRGNRLAGKARSRKADGLGVCSFLGKNSKELAGSTL